MTTGFSFDGYRITDYIRIISGESVMGTGFLSEFKAAISDLLGSQSKAFSNKLAVSKEHALQCLKQRASESGANAIIGVDFDYINFQGSMIGVVASGTCVFIEKV